MPTSDDETIALLQENRRKPNLTSQQRRDIVQALLVLMVVPGALHCTVHPLVTVYSILYY
jgi:hypothetical protein